MHLGRLPDNPGNRGNSCYFAHGDADRQPAQPKMDRTTKEKRWRQWEQAVWPSARLVTV